MRKKSNGTVRVKLVRSQADMDKAVKGICNILRRDKAKGARLYVPELTWMFFLRYLDLIEEAESERSAVLGESFSHSIASPYRWHDWASPYDARVSVQELEAIQAAGW